jgi:hypothetical protein
LRENRSSPRAGRDGVLLVSSSGGVLLDVLALEPWWSRHEVHWAVVKAPDTEAAVDGAPHTWIVELTPRSPLRLLRAFWDAARTFRRVRPGIVVSAGTGCAVPFFVIARAVGIPTFWLSTLNVVRTPGRAARVCGRLADRVLLQQRTLLEAEPSGVVIGELY